MKNLALIPRPAYSVAICSRRKFLGAIALASGVGLLPRRARAIAAWIEFLVVIAVVLIVGYLVLSFIAEVIKEWFSPPPPPKKKEELPYYPPNAPITSAPRPPQRELPGDDTRAEEPELLPGNYPIAPEINYLNPNNGERLTNFGWGILQNSQDGGATWTDHAFAVWANATYFICEFDGQATEGSNPGQVRIEPTEPGLWRVKE